MKIKEQLIKQKEEIEKQIKELEEKEKLKEFEEIKFKNKIFRIYKWEKKPFKDFVYPKGFRLSEEREFIDLYDSGFKVEEYPVIYFTKNRSKLNIKNDWGLSGLYLNGSLNLGSGYGDLANSYVNGRVVIVRDLK